MTGSVGSWQRPAGGTYTFTGNTGSDTVVIDATAVSAQYPIYFAGGIAAGRLYDTYYGTTINITGTEVLEFTGNANVSTVINGVTYTGVSGGNGNDILTGLNQSDTFRWWRRAMTLFRASLAMTTSREVPATTSSMVGPGQTLLRSITPTGRAILCW